MWSHTFAKDKKTNNGHKRAEVNFFTVRMVKYCHKLPEIVVQSLSVRIFKAQLNKVLSQTLKHMV